MTNTKTSWDPKDYQKHEDLPRGMRDEFIDDGRGGFITKAADEVNLAASKKAYKNHLAGILDATEPQDILHEEAIKVNEDMERKANINKRHKVPESDSSVKKLMELEERYKDNPEELAKVQAIIVHADSIEIAGMKLKRTNESAPTNEKEGIFDYNGNTLFNWKAAMEKYGNKMPSNDQWGTILDAIPGKSDRTHRENMAEILDIPYAGCRDADGGFDSADRRASLWSSSKGDSDSAHVVYLNRVSDEARRY
jgi:hypothetical protein